MHSIPPFPSLIYLHHATVLTCFLSALWHENFSGYLSAALIVEYHGVFLHLRQLLKLSHSSPSGFTSRVVLFGNICSLLVFRLAFHSWLTLHVWTSRPSFPSVFSFSVAFYGMVTVSLLNLDLARKLIT